MTLGFNQSQSENIINIDSCLLLTDELNQCLEKIRDLLKELCQISYPIMKKNKKVGAKNISKGDVVVCHSDNGIDIVLEFEEDLTLDYRMIICEKCHASNNIIRISHRKNSLQATETIVEKIKPEIKIADYNVYIPAGTFLQATKSSEQKMINVMLNYLGDTGGKIADLF